MVINWRNVFIAGILVVVLWICLIIYNVYIYLKGESNAKLPEWLENKANSNVIILILKDKLRRKQ